MTNLSATLSLFNSAIGTQPTRRKMLLRALGVYTVVALLGLMPLVLHLSPKLQAMGIGLWFPGVGFLAVGGWAAVAFPLTLLLFLVGLFLWFAMGALAVPMALWLVTAVIAGLMTRRPIETWSPYVAAGLVLASIALGTALSLRKHARQLALRDKREAYLPEALAKLQAAASPRPDIAARELSPRDLAHMRFFIDRGLQPVESFNGFTIIDQFQPAALRYSLNFMQYALAIQQCQYTPSFHGYLSKAQRNLIAKFQDKRVWGYWVWEKVLGHFSLNFDPIGRDNIMLGGFMNLNINLYQANTGRPMLRPTRRFSVSAE